MLNSNILNMFADQIQDLKKKQENQVQLLKQKQKSDDAAKRLQDEIQSIKAQKVGFSRLLNTLSTTYMQLMFFPFIGTIAA